MAEVCDLPVTNTTKAVLDMQLTVVGTGHAHLLVERDAAVVAGAGFDPLK
jgi:hypothetical protein